MRHIHITIAKVSLISGILGFVIGLIIGDVFMIPAAIIVASLMTKVYV